MRSENFVAFFTVSGFFVGLIFSLLKTTQISEFFLMTFVITFFFYIFIHLILTFFFTIEPTIKGSFNKDDSEAMINLQIVQLKEKENIFEEIRSSIKELNSQRNSIS